MQFSLNSSKFFTTVVHFFIGGTLRLRNGFIHVGILLVMSSALYAGGFQLNEHGARAMAQAGAFAARGYDLSAVFFNPAGLSYQRGTRFLAGATIITPSFRFRGPTNLNTNQEWKMEDQIFTPINVYAGHTFTEGALSGLGLAIGVYNPYGLGTKWPDDWIGRNISQEILLETFFITPTVSYAINDMIAVGVGFNYVLGNVTMRRAVDNFDPSMQLDLEGNGSGIGWNAGIIFRPLETVSLGFTYRSSVPVDFEGTTNFVNRPSSLEALFPGGDVKTSIELPATYFAAIAVSPIEGLEVEFDYQGVQWSSYDKLVIDFVTDAESDPNGVVKQEDVSSPKDYEDSYILRFGLEYKLPVMGLTLRAGYLFDKNPVPDTHLEPLLPDADRNGYNFGVGFNITPNLTIDVAYLFEQFQERTTNATSFPDGVYFDGTYNGTAHLFAINIGYVIR